MGLAVPTHELRYKRKRNDQKGVRGVCRIQKSCTGNRGSDQRYQTVGSGGVIRHNINEQWKCKYFIVTTSNIFPEDCDLRNYRVSFVKSKSKLKTFQLSDAVVGEAIYRNPSGLAVIPLNSRSSVFRHGRLLRRKCGILRHYSFEVEPFDSAETSDSKFLNGLCCHSVADDLTTDLFGVKPLGLSQNSSGHYSTHLNPLHNYVPLGAAIIRRNGNKWSAAGVLSSCSSGGVCCPAWLSRENFANLRKGCLVQDVVGTQNIQPSKSGSIGKDEVNVNEVEEEHCRNETASDHEAAIPAKDGDKLTVSHERKLVQVAVTCHDFSKSSRKAIEDDSLGISNDQHSMNEEQTDDALRTHRDDGGKTESGQPRGVHEKAQFSRSLNISQPARNYSEFNAFLLRVADQIREEELEAMKFLCDEQTNDNYLPRGKLLAIKSQREFLSFLRQHGKICPDDVSYLVWLLRNVGLKELADSIAEQGPPSLPEGQPRNLPCSTAHFVGRDADVEQIIKKLQTFRMVVILSMPGMGKTEVGVRVSHLLKQEGDHFVTHIRVESHHQKLEDVCSEILGRLSSRVWPPTADFVSIAKRKLSERNIPTVIVLDNTENIQDEELDDFVKGLVKSAPNVKLIITTRKDIGFVSPDVCKFPLKPLDHDSSAQLLRSLVDVFSEEHYRELAELCGGIPFLLVTCSDLLNNGFGLESLIQHLRNNPIKLIKTSANDVYNTLKVFFTKFSDEVKQNLILFSVFPSEFSAQDTKFLFEDSLHFETEKTRMAKCALLHRDADGKMRMHALVQDYFRTEKESLGMGDLWRATQRKFNHHYLKLLTALSRKFISRDSALAAIHKFRQQKANIMKALKNCLEDSSDSVDKNFVLDVVNSTEVLDFVAKVLTPPKECTMLYQKCCDIAKTSGDKKKHAESLNSLGFRRLCDVSHSKDSPEETLVTLTKFQEAYDMRSTLPEEERKSQTHAHTASKLGVCFVLQGDEEKGRKLIQEGISIRESLCDHLYLAAGYCDLGNSHRLCGDHQKAIDIWKKNTLPVYKQQLGDHPWTASILSYIADSYKSLADGSSEPGYIDWAEKYFREALELRKKLLGDHQDTARSRVQLSDVLFLRGQFDKALEELNKAFIIQNDILGPDHKITMNTVSKRNNVRDKLGSNLR